MRAVRAGGAAAGAPPLSSGSFDRVLLDAPCSGTGTLRHNPEIRWRLTENDINRLAEQQYRLLQNAASVVRQGGVLVYSTCSVEREENENVVADFLLTNEQFRQIRIPVNESLRAEGGAARTWPHRDGTDGFYIAVFEHKLKKCRSPPLMALCNQAFVSVQSLITVPGETANTS